MSRFLKYKIRLFVLCRFYPFPPDYLLITKYPPDRHHVWRRCRCAGHWQRIWHGKGRFRGRRCPTSCLPIYCRQTQASGIYLFRSHFIIILITGGFKGGGGTTGQCPLWYSRDIIHNFALPHFWVSQRLQWAFLLLSVVRRPASGVRCLLSGVQHLASVKFLHIQLLLINRLPDLNQTW